MMLQSQSIATCVALGQQLKKMANLAALSLIFLVTQMLRVFGMRASVIPCHSFPSSLALATKIIFSWVWQYVTSKRFTSSASRVDTK